MDHLARMAELGLIATSWLPDPPVKVGDRLLSLPRDLVGTDGKTSIIYRSASEPNYDFAGWEPWHAGHHGGRYREIGHALGWLERMRRESVGPSAQSSAMFMAMRDLFYGGDFAQWLNEQAVPISVVNEYEKARTYFESMTGFNTRAPK